MLLSWEMLLVLELLLKLERSLRLKILLRSKMLISLEVDLRLETYGSSSLLSQCRFSTNIIDICVNIFVAWSLT